MKFSRNLKCVDKLLVYGLLLFLFGGILFLLSKCINCAKCDTAFHNLLTDWV